MSGPKVFHVVTREELVARCEAHLRQLDAAIAAHMQVPPASHALKRSGDRRGSDAEILRQARADRRLLFLH